MKKWKLPEDPQIRMLLGMTVLTVILTLAGYIFYIHLHTFDAFRIRSGHEKQDVEGTQYIMLGKSVVKYSHDGLFCVDLSGNVKWSIAYSMPNPICDTNGKCAVIAEQQGQQVYVINEDGVLGHYETDLNIRKIRAASNGVAALLMEEEEVSWIRLYSAKGEQIASVRATLEGSGYPLDIALTMDARRMAVSYMGINNMDLSSDIAFYDFSSAADDADSHLKGSVTYKDEVFPVIYYAGKNLVAAGDSEFIVFDSKNNEKTRVPLEQEIVSCFHDSSHIGFIFRSEQPDVKYELEVYNYRGKCTMTTQCTFEFEEARFDHNEILLWDAGHLNVYRANGRQKLDCTYEDDVHYFASLSGIRNYLVVTDGSIDRIWIE